MAPVNIIFLIMTTISQYQKRGSYLVRLIIVADSKEKARICQPMMYTIIMPNNQQQEEQQQQQH